VAIPGVSVAKFLKSSADARFGQGALKPAEFIKEMRDNMKFLEMNEVFLNRFLNEGFSGGEKKRMEILQMLTLKPKFAVMDETDSGLDIDALRIVSKGVNRLAGPNFRSAGHHALRAHPDPHQAGPHARADRRPDRVVRRAGAGPEGGEAGLRLDPRTVRTGSSRLI
jgi:ABC-type ATPase with predicted acetyltransferase domain